MKNEVVLKTDNLQVFLPNNQGILRAVNGVDLEIKKGKILGLVGESGCGKSVMSLSLLGLLKNKEWKIEGEIELRGKNLLSLSKEEMRKVRGKEMAMIMQNPMSVFDPLTTIGGHFVDTIQNHIKITTKEAKKIALENLKKVSLPNPEKIMKQYPFQLSGGMLQRVMIAIAIALNPAVLIADEPTTAVDVTVQHQILGQLKKLVKEHNTGVLLVSHDLGVIAQMADEVAVMYCGYIVEKAPVEELFRHPAHPYTKGLLSSRFQLTKRRLKPIEGQPPSLINLSNQCPFLERCNEAEEICTKYRMDEIGGIKNHLVRCAKYVTGNEVMLHELA
ncbi:peptide/nickel transport system ATP-binding protein/nickel transport system ATP-binding protein [Anaerovirgula multivorans]|uniref:Nickel import system ATP-binding protein NikD n=1 Tax=Anaerovirgula multivorans TaxID=312168 RepID=A0A239IL64_9FIRM|nr:ABC transporter ATP-binding protein [Anaerovirgula multivorans]SNS93793.1 peptide/nickel transport system ATP-binding protein/nickel transport system ATP-binding protein [Anaerovirgula multivorans]